MYKLNVFIKNHWIIFKKLKGFIFFINILMRFLPQKIIANVAKNSAFRGSIGVLNTLPYDPCPERKHLSLVPVNLETMFFSSRFNFYINGTLNIKASFRKNSLFQEELYETLQRSNLRFGWLFQPSINKSPILSKISSLYCFYHPFYNQSVNLGCKVISPYLTGEIAGNFPLKNYFQQSADEKKRLSFGDVRILSKNFKLLPGIFLNLVGNLKIMPKHPGIWYTPINSNESIHCSCSGYVRDFGFKLSSRYGTLCFSELSLKSCNIQYIFSKTHKSFKEDLKENFWPAPLNFSISSCDCIHTKRLSSQESLINPRRVFENKLGAALFSLSSSARIIELLEQNEICSQKFLQSPIFSQLPIKSSYAPELLEWIIFQTIFSELPEFSEICRQLKPERGVEFETIKKMLLENKNETLLLQWLFSDLSSERQRKIVLSEGPSPLIGLLRKTQLQKNFHYLKNSKILLEMLELALDFPKENLLQDYLDGYVFAGYQLSRPYISETYKQRLIDKLSFYSANDLEKVQKKQGAFLIDAIKGKVRTDALLLKLVAFASNLIFSPHPLYSSTIWDIYTQEILTKSNPSMGNIFTLKTWQQILQSSSTDDLKCNVLMRLLKDGVPGNYWYHLSEKINPRLITGRDIYGFSIWHYFFFYRGPQKNISKYDNFWIQLIHSAAASECDLKIPWWDDWCYFYTSLRNHREVYPQSQNLQIECELLKYAKYFDSTFNEKCHEIFQNNVFFMRVKSEKAGENCPFYGFHKNIYEAFCGDFDKFSFNASSPLYRRTVDISYIAQLFALYQNYIREHWGKKAFIKQFLDAFNRWINALGANDHKISTKIQDIRKQLDEDENQEIKENFLSFSKNTLYFLIHPDKTFIQTHIHHPETKSFMCALEKLANSPPPNEKKYEDINYLFQLLQIFQDQLKVDSL